MLEMLEITNFKAFKHLSLPLRPLTLLSGLNGMGKSTAIQSLLLLRQSYLGRLPGDHGQQPRLVLNGNLIELGTGHDVICRSADSDDFVFDVTFSEGRLIWQYQISRQANALEPLVDASQEFDIANTCLFSDKFHYLQAERLGPRVSYAVDDYQVRERGNFGTRGEYIPHFLHYWDKVAKDSWVVEKAMSHTEAVSEKLTAQVEAWMSEISPGVRLGLQPLDGTDLIRLQIAFGNNEFYRATNVGFGITYTLPIVVALLASTPGTLLLLENPEAHLHPRGQSKIGELISRAASIGVQVILETHSDHILNGIRIAARNKLIDAKDVALHFFQRSESAGNGTEVVSPRLSQQGRLDFWPDGFFDQWDNSLDALM